MLAAHAMRDRWTETRAQFHGSIPLDRHTELVATIPDEAIYSIAIPSTELEVGDYYLSVQCGPKANTFRGVMFEVRGLLSGPLGAVDWICFT